MGKMKQSRSMGWCKSSLKNLKRILLIRYNFSNKNEHHLINTLIIPLISTVASNIRDNSAAAMMILILAPWLLSGKGMVLRTKAGTTMESAGEDITRGGLAWIMHETTRENPETNTSMLTCNESHISIIIFINYDSSFKSLCKKYDWHQEAVWQAWAGWIYIKIMKTQLGICQIITFI